MELFFYLSKLFWLVAKPGNALFLLILLGVILLWSKRAQWGRLILTVTVAGMVVVAFIPVGKWLLHPLEHRFPINPELPEKVDGIIVLSGGVGAKPTAVMNQIQVNEQVDRELAFMRLALRYPEAKLLYTGGSSSLTHQQFKGADAARRMMEEQGFDVGRVVFERESRNTVESALLSQSIMLPKEGENWLLITTAWHLPRSVGVFCKVGWATIPYPVDFSTTKEGGFGLNFSFAGHLNGLEIGVKEWLGLTAYWLSGKTTGLLPSTCGEASI